MAEESGTGFLVAEKLLLTAQHVVESSAGIIADPDSIEVTFDFWYQPDTTWAEAGDTVPVVDVVIHSPPTDKERSTAKGVDWEAPDQYLDYAILQLERRSINLVSWPVQVPRPLSDSFYLAPDSARASTFARPSSSRRHN